MKKFLRKITKPIVFYALLPSGEQFQCPPDESGKIIKGWQCLELSDISGLIRYGIMVFLGVIGAYALIMLIWGAWQYLTAYGNEEKAQKAKTTILWAIIGTAVTLLAWVFVDTIWDLVTGGVAPERP